MPNPQLIESVVGMRPFIPAKDFELSKRFYRDVGFDINYDSSDVAELSIGKFSFLLQNYYDKSWAEYCAMHLYVTDLKGWWKHISTLKLVDKYGVHPPKEPKMQAWGMEVGHFYDPSSVLWHVAAADDECQERMSAASPLQSKTQI